MRTELDRITEINSARDLGIEAGRAAGRAEGLLEGRAAGLQEGEAKGREERDRAIAALVSKGIDMSVIAECYGLTDAEISQYSTPK